jgi:arginyl-tRNA synthetase
MKSQLQDLLERILKELAFSSPSVVVFRPENPHHGDYATNVAFLIGKEQKKNPIDIAHTIVDYLLQKKNEGKNQKEFKILQDIEKLSIAGPGFINITLTHARFSSNLSQVIKDKEGYGKSCQLPAASCQPKNIMVEFAHPNTHKAFHIGHLRNITTGESIVRLLEAGGNTVIRANYQGDVGMHIAKCLYALMRFPAISSELSTAREKGLHEKIALLGKAYAAGSQAYEENEAAKEEIGEINKKIYAKDPDIYPLYEETRQWSLLYFDLIYKRLGSRFDRLYFESEVYESGKKHVEEGVKRGIFVKSDGAIIFPGETLGLHNRVFVTREGNPTYEGKEMGLGPLQFAEYHPDRIIHIVGPEQAGYFEVCFEALGQLFPDTRGREEHLVYGWVKLKHGKMSSRTGNVVYAEWLLDEVKTSIYKILDQSQTKYKKEDREAIAETCAIAAVKYSILKVGLSQEIAFDIEESINIHGDSGPYLLYTYARCQSVLRKAESSALSRQPSGDLNEEERQISRLILYFPEIVEEAAAKRAPSDIARYLTDLAKAFNAFYAKHKILDSETVRQSDSQSVSMSQSEVALPSHRLLLTAATAQVLNNGLYLLGIGTIERM